MRRWVDPAAGLPARVLPHAPSASRTVAGSSSALTGSEARATHPRAAAISRGGTCSRVAGLNAQANSACRSTLPSGAPFSLAVSATVTVTRDSATERRETGARPAHLASAYLRACSYQVIISPSVVSAAGRPVRWLNGLRLRAASLRPSRNPSARVLFRKDLQCSRSSTAHRTRYRPPLPLSPIFLMSQNLTS